MGTLQVLNPDGIELWNLAAIRAGRALASAIDIDAVGSSSGTHAAAAKMATAVDVHINCVPPPPPPLSPSPPPPVTSQWTPHRPSLDTGRRRASKPMGLNTRDSWSGSTPSGNRPQHGQRRLGLLLLRRDSSPRTSGTFGCSTTMVQLARHGRRQHELRVQHVRRARGHAAGAQHGRHRAGTSRATRARAGSRPAKSPSTTTPFNAHARRQLASTQLSTTC